MKPAEGFSEWVRGNYVPFVTVCLVLLAGIVRGRCGSSPTQTAPGRFAFSLFDDEKGTRLTQKAILVYEGGREDLLLQAGHEGTAQELGWLIAVPTAPEVRQGSIKCFFELSRFTREPLWPEEFDSDSLLSSGGNTNWIKPIEIQTIGRYEVTMISPEDKGRFAEWLASTRLSVSAQQKSLLESYVKKNWWLIAARVDPAEGFSRRIIAQPFLSEPPVKDQKTRESTPLIISFASDKCVYPLALSTAAERQAELSLFVFAEEPLMSRAIFQEQYEEVLKQRQEWIRQRPERERAYYASTNRSARSAIEFQGLSRRANPYEDPNDPRPAPEVLVELQTGPVTVSPFAESDDDFRAGFPLVRCFAANGNDFPECTKVLPRLAGKKWWLTKQTIRATFEPQALKIEAAVPMFAEKLHTPEGRMLAQTLPPFGTYAVPVVRDCLNSPEPAERRAALAAMAWLADPSLVEFLPRFFDDPDQQTRANACRAAQLNWDSKFAPRLVELLSDNIEEVRRTACGCLQSHETESAQYIPTYRKMIEEGGVAAPLAMTLLRHHHVELPARSLSSFFSSDDPCTIKQAIFDLHDRVLSLKEIEPLLTNSLPLARVHGLVLLLHRGDKEAMDRIVAMLNDPHEGLRWTVRQNLRRLSGQKLGADPAAWEKWWAENRESFTTVHPNRPPRK